jgi:hypothetical protein
MHYWINFIAFQLVWFAAVGGASRGWGWVGPLAFIVFAALHAAWAPRVRGEWRMGDGGWRRLVPKGCAVCFRGAP